MLQYGVFWYRALQGDFGYSFRYGVPATRLIVERLPNSLRLGAVAAVIGIVVGLPLGVIAALKRGTIIDNLTTSVAVFGIVVPQFWLGIMLIIIFSVEFGLLPTSGTGSWKHIILPAVTLSTGLTATVARMARSGMLEALNQDYVRTARAKARLASGLSSAGTRCETPASRSSPRRIFPAPSHRHGNRGGGRLRVAGSGQPHGPSRSQQGLSRRFLGRHPLRRSDGDDVSHHGPPICGGRSQNPTPVD